MKKITLITAATMFAGTAMAQAAPAADSSAEGKITVYKDSRIDALAGKQSSKDAGPLGPRAAKGYRLMIINTNDRDLALKVRGQLLQRFPDQKVYMSFKPPYIQLKFGNFIEKGEADRFKLLIRKSGIVTTSIYAVPEIVEVKPPKDGEKEKETKDQ